MEKYREKGRSIDYSRPENKLILKLAERGFSVFCIWREVNRRQKGHVISPGQVYYRIRHGGFPLRMVRDGQTQVSKDEINKIVIRLYASPRRKAV